MIWMLWRRRFLNLSAISKPLLFKTQHFSQSETKPQKCRHRTFLRNFAVSYLEPRALYSLQRIISEAPDELNREGRERRLKPDTERDENKTLKASHQDGISELDFNSELKRAFSATDYAKVTAVYRQAVQVNVPEVTLLFGGNPASENPSRYAAEAYTAAADLTQAKEPLINLMHNNNRNFDYKIWNSSDSKVTYF